MEREKFKSRLGFILISAGCAIGIGNVWRFPYVAGNNGGGAFVLFYLFFLIVIGVPILSMEFAIGRASKKSAVMCYQELEKPGQKWHLHGYVAMIGNYILMIFYTTVSGWMFSYFFKFLFGNFSNSTSEEVSQTFDNLLTQPAELAFWMILIVLIGFGICSLGLQKGVERVTKFMMIALICLIGILAINSLTLSGGLEGLKFYLIPDFNKMQEVGIANVIVAAMNQAFFTLSIGMGSMEIFGSYMDKSHTLLGESVQIALLDTFVAIAAGLIIFPACFAYNVNPDSGPSLIFKTLPNVFISMPFGQIWGSLFFLFMTFASLSTIIAVFENIIACCMDAFKWSRKKAVGINLIIVIIASMPCVLGFNVLSDFQPLGNGSSVLDLEDFMVSNIILPLGSLVYLLFCVTKKGWGFKNYQAECNQGSGLKLPNSIRFYVTYILPIIILFIFIWGII